MSDMTEAPGFSAAATRGSGPNARQSANLDYFGGVSLRISVEVGSTSLPLSDILKLAEGSVIELDRQAHDVLDIFANGTLIAKGEVVTVEGRYAVRVTKVTPTDAKSPGFERRL
jgi:flagellar motor switch protein FliN/FliY